MIWAIVVVLMVLALLYFLNLNNKLNINSLTDSSPSLGQSSDSVQVDERTGQMSVKFNSPKIKSLRVLHGDNKISKIYVAERPLSYNEIIEEGNRSITNNCVFLGTLSDTPATASTSTGVGNSDSTARLTSVFEIKQFKNTFIVFKSVDTSKIKETSNMVRYESEGMVYCLVDASATSVAELQQVSYPIVVYTTSAAAQLKLAEYNYQQVNDAGTMFIKNQKSFRIQ